MTPIQLLPVGETDPSLLDFLALGLSAEFCVQCQALKARFDPEPSFNLERQQYFSTDLLERMQKRFAPKSFRLLGVTALDLYIPILTFVFGEAHLNGPCALVSTWRLRQEFYGLPPQPELLRERLVKEAVHELGHTLGLAHCDDYRCAMSPSHAVERIDLKSGNLCARCRTLSASRLSSRRAGGD